MAQHRRAKPVLRQRQVRDVPARVAALREWQKQQRQRRRKAADVVKRRERRATRQAEQIAQAIGEARSRLAAREADYRAQIEVLHAHRLFTRSSIAALAGIIGLVVGASVVLRYFQAHKVAAAAGILIGSGVWLAYALAVMAAVIWYDVWLEPTCRRKARITEVEHHLATVLAQRCALDEGRYSLKRLNGPQRTWHGTPYLVHFG